MTKLTPVVYTYQVPIAFWHDPDAMNFMRLKALDWIGSRSAGRELETHIDRGMGDRMAVAISTQACMEVVAYDGGFASWQSQRSLEALGFTLTDGFSTMLSVVSGIGVSIRRGLARQDERNRSESLLQEEWEFPLTVCDDHMRQVKEPSGGSLDDWMERSGDVLEEYEGYCTTDDALGDVAAPIELECLRCEGPVPVDRGFCHDCTNQINATGNQRIVND